MDRSYKAKDRVQVHQSERSGDLLDTFEQRPYSHAGFDNYEYRGVMYPGFVDQAMQAYILLDRPLFPRINSAGRGRSLTP